MLHELLLALSGYPGNVFVQDSDTNSVKVLPDLPFMHATEVALLNKLCRLATYYLKFRSFIDENSYSFGQGKEVPVGLYIRSLCFALDEALEPYRQTLIRIEKELLADPHLTAAYVQMELEEYHLLFPTLSRLIDEITSRKIHGCGVLELLFEASMSGMPNVKVVINRLLYHSLRVLYKQLAAWMLHGILIDQFAEFFIHRVDAGTRPDTLEAFPEDELGLGGITGRQMAHIMQLSEESFSSKSRETFAVRVELLPSFIPLRAAEKILFVGESVQMFESQKDSLKKHSGRVSILHDKEEEFTSELQKLAQNSSFSLMAFENVVDKIRSHVSELLWQLIVEETNLRGRLRNMKDFYLLGRGELFLAFIDQAQSLLRTPPISNTQHDVNLAFSYAARNLLLEDERLLKLFKFTIENTDSEPSASGQMSVLKRESGWNCLNLTLNVEWPLHILFTPGVLERYNTVFRFLLYVRRIQLELQQCWSLRMQRRHLHLADVGSNKWWLRSHMAFLVDNLQYYLQVDVIESQYSILMNKIENTRDFEVLRLAHDHFLSSLLSQCFIHMKHISGCLKEILELCNAFCGLMMHAEVILSAQEMRQLDEITQGFQRQSNLLFKLLSSIRSHQASPHLCQLLLRIDFNKYFSMAGGQLGKLTGLKSAKTILQSE